mgnify:CR=1 FL=1|jgi:proliferating cell nuclear antigen PCNA
MKLEINDKSKANKFSHLFKCLKDVVDIVTLDFKKEGLYFQAMDSSQICLCELVLTTEWFQKYEIEKNETVTIPTSGMYHCLHCFNEGQSIHMSYNENKDYLNIEFLGEKTLEKSFDLTTFESNDSLMDIPEVDYSVDIEMVSSELNSVIQELIIFNKDIEFNCNQEWLQLITRGELGKMSVKLKDDNVISYAIEEDLTLKRVYSIEFFKRACAFHKLSETINLHLNTDLPIKIAYYLENNSNFKFYIAPKMDDDEF